MVTFRATVNTLENIKALEVDGMFDDCQDMVKKPFWTTLATPHLTLS
jgi:threonine synthase